MTDQIERHIVRPSTGLSVADLSCQRGERRLFDGLALQVAPGGALHVGGANGVGKTTLLRVLAGLTRPESGTLCWNGAPLHGGEHTPRVAYLGHANALKEDFSALENLRHASPAGASISAHDAHGALEWIGLAEQARLPVRHLSQGQRRRVALARLMLAQDRPVWLVDEPFAALDRSAIALVCALLDAQRARDGIVVYTTHDETRLAGAGTFDLDGAAAGRGEGTC